VQTDYLAKTKPKIQTQFDAGERDEVPFAIILGSDELKDGVVTVKEQRWQFVEGIKQKVKQENSNRGITIKREELVDWLKLQEALQNWQTGRLIS
jgi:histidyl-tRNA synthetase